MRCMEPLESIKEAEEELLSCVHDEGAKVNIVRVFAKLAGEIGVYRDRDMELDMLRGSMVRQREYFKNSYKKSLSQVTTFFARQGCGVGSKRGKCCCGCLASICCYKCTNRAWDGGDTPLPTTQLDFLSIFNGNELAVNYAEQLRDVLDRQYAHEVALVRNKLLSEVKSRELVITDLERTVATLTASAAPAPPQVLSPPPPPPPPHPKKRKKKKDFKKRPPATPPRQPTPVRQDVGPSKPAATYETKTTSNVINAIKNTASNHGSSSCNSSVCSTPAQSPRTTEDARLVGQGRTECIKRRTSPRFCVKIKQLGGAKRNTAGSDASSACNRDEDSHGDKDKDKDKDRDNKDGNSAHTESEAGEVLNEATTTASSVVEEVKEVVKKNEAKEHKKIIFSQEASEAHRDAENRTATKERPEPYKECDTGCLDDVAIDFKDEMVKGWKCRGRAVLTPTVVCNTAEDCTPLIAPEPVTMKKEAFPPRKRAQSNVALVQDAVIRKVFDSAITLLNKRHPSARVPVPMLDDQCQQLIRNSLKGKKYLSIHSQQEADACHDPPDTLDAMKTELAVQLAQKRRQYAPSKDIPPEAFSLCHRESA